jgi:hypothetical protein
MDVRDKHERICNSSRARDEEERGFPTCAVHWEAQSTGTNESKAGRRNRLRDTHGC